MEVHITEPGETLPGITWVAAWGDQVTVGDLLRVTKLGGPVRVVHLRKFFSPKDTGRTALVSGDDDGRWFLGTIVEDPSGQQYHLFVQPHEAVFLALETTQEAHQ